MSSTLTLFTGKAHDAVGTVMPGVCEWVEQTFQDLTDVRETDDHGVIVWANMPTAGILGAHKKDWCVTFLANVLQKFKRNSIAVLVHTNRAAQASPGSGFFSKLWSAAQLMLLKPESSFFTNGPFKKNKLQPLLILATLTRKDADKSTKDEDEKMKYEKKEEPDDDDEASHESVEGQAEDAEVRDVRYQLEMLSRSQHHTNMKHSKLTLSNSCNPSWLSWH